MLLNQAAAGQGVEKVITGSTHNPSITIMIKNKKKYSKWQHEVAIRRHNSSLTRWSWDVIFASIKIHCTNWTLLGHSLRIALECDETPCN